MFSKCCQNPFNNRFHEVSGSNVLDDFEYICGNHFANLSLYLSKNLLSRYNFVYYDSMHYLNV